MSESRHDALDIVQQAEREIRTALREGGPLLAAERLIWWLCYHPEAIGDTKKWRSIHSELERRILSYWKGWEQPRTWSFPAEWWRPPVRWKNKAWQSKKVRSLDEAFPEMQKDRAESSPSAKAPDETGCDMLERLPRAVSHWMRAHLDRSLEHAFADLAYSVEFPLGADALKDHIYYPQLHRAIAEAWCLCESQSKKPSLAAFAWALRERLASHGFPEPDENATKAWYRKKRRGVLKFFRDGRKEGQPPKSVRIIRHGSTRPAD